MNQTTDAVSAGLKTLVAGGIQSADELTRYAPVIAKTATATRAQMDDISDTFLALANNMKISAADSESAMNIMVKSTKLGQVEFKDMAKWIPKLTPMLAGLGMSGKESVAQLASMLQVAKIGAGTADEAGNNLVNLLTKINAPDTIKDFEKVGIDLKASLKASALNGIDPVTAMLGTVEAYMNKALSPKDLAKYQAALAEKDNAKSAQMFKSLSEAGNMGQLFQDMQAMSALRALLQNKDKLQSFSADSLAAGNTDMLGADFDKRTAGFNEKMKQLKINLVDIGITVGETLIPSILSLVESVKPMINAVAEFAKANPEFIKWSVGLLAAGIAAKVFTSSVAFAVNLLIKSPVNQAVMTWKQLSAAFTLAKLGLSNFLPVFVKGILAAGKSLLFLGKGFLTVGRYALLFAQGLGMGLGMPIVMLGKGLLMLTSLLGVKLLAGLRVAATGFMLLGRAMLFTPLGLIIAGVAALAYGAYQLYANWEPVKAWFSDLWQSIATAATAKIDSMTATITSWVNDIKSLFQSLLNWLDGLWQGIKDKANNGISSVQSMANELLPSAMQFNVKPMDVPEPNRLAGKGNVIDQSTIHFSPNITLPPGTPEATVSTVKQALTISQTEFEQRYKTMMKQQTRTGYAAQ
jgi:TP901 family phage tail tape measure protein